MTNPIEILREATREAKILGRLADQPSKVKKHRYKRRIVPSFLRLGEWNQDDSN
jgi:hypothetical protein